MEIRFRVDMPRASARAASLVLSSVTLMRDGLQLVVTGGGGDFVRRLNEATRGGVAPGAAPYLGDERLMAVGDYALNRHAWLVLPAPERLLLTQAILEMRPPKDDLRLVSLSSGSLEAVVEDVIEHIGGFFRTLLESVNSVLKGGEGKELKELVGEFPTLPQQAESRLIGAGVIMVAAESLRSSYATRDIRRIYVE